MSELQFALQVRHKAHIPRMSVGSENAPEPRPVRKLPAEALCRAKRASGPGMVACLTPDSSDCDHFGFFEGAALCLNPHRDEIVARTQTAF